MYIVLEKDTQVPGELATDIYKQDIHMTSFVSANGTVIQAR